MLVSGNRESQAAPRRVLTLGTAMIRRIGRSTTTETRLLSGSSTRIQASCRTGGTRLRLILDHGRPARCTGRPLLGSAPCHGGNVDRLLAGSLSSGTHPIAVGTVRRRSPTGRMPAPSLPQPGGVGGTGQQPIDNTGVPYGIRTRVTNVKGWCPGPLDERDSRARLWGQAQGLGG